MKEKIINIINNKIKIKEKDYQFSASQGMPTGAILAEIDTLIELKKEIIKIE